MQERSAEWLRGAVWVAKQLLNEKLAALYAAELAEAEARESSVSTAEEVIAAAEKQFRYIFDVAQTTKAMENEAAIALAAIAKWKEAQNA